MSEAGKGATNPFPAEFIQKKKTRKVHETLIFLSMAIFSSLMDYDVGRTCGPLKPSINVFRHECLLRRKKKENFLGNAQGETQKRRWIIMMTASCVAFNRGLP